MTCHVLLDICKINLHVSNLFGITYCCNNKYVHYSLPLEMSEYNVEFVLQK